MAQPSARVMGAHPPLAYDGSLDTTTAKGGGHARTREIPARDHQGHHRPPRDISALPSVLEEYEAEVDHQVALMPPKFQQPKHWEEWSGVIEARIKQLQQAQGPKTPGQG